MPGLEDELGDVVRKARSGLGLEIGELSRKTGIPEQELKGIEVYTKHPGEAEVRRLAESLQLRPDQLWELAEDTWSPPEPAWTIGDALTIDCLTNSYPEHCYIVTARSGDCFIVDPGEEPERIVETATSGGRKPAGILITHSHRDHTGAVVPVQKATGAPVFVHTGDADAVKGVPAAAVHTIDGDRDIEVGSIRVQVLHTPGHTPGSATYIVRAGGATAAFCGDTLFSGSVGRALAGYEAILHSVREKLARLPAATALYPGHGPATTVANERERNPFL